MPKERKAKSVLLRHNPLGYSDEASRKSKAKKPRTEMDDDNDLENNDEALPPSLESKIYKQAKEQQFEIMTETRGDIISERNDEAADSDYSEDDEVYLGLVK